jgi:hypothetical protein
MQRKVVLVVLAVAAIACAWILEITKVESKDVPGYETKRKAADIAAEAFTTLEAHYTRPSSAPSTRTSLPSSRDTWRSYASAPATSWPWP